MNRAPEDSEEFEVLGIRMQFFTKYGTDDQAHTTVWLPEREICIENALWSTPPNMYSIRGDVFRDAREWAALVRIVRDLEPKVLVGYGHKPIVGREKISRTLTAYLDGTCSHGSHRAEEEGHAMTPAHCLEASETQAASTQLIIPRGSPPTQSSLQGGDLNPTKQSYRRS